MRCAHNPAPCHFFEPSGETCEAFRPSNKQWFWKLGDQFWGSGSHFGVLDTYFQDFWDGYMFLSKNVPSRTPSKTHSNPFFTVLWFDCFFEFCMWWIFMIFSAQRLHSGVNFRAFSEALGLFQNSCVTTVIFRGLTPFGRHLCRGLDRECVLRLSFYRNLRFGGVLRNRFRTLLVLIVVKNRSA